VRAFLDHLGRTLKRSQAHLHARALRFRPLFERQCPRLLEEVDGLAEGAGVPLVARPLSLATRPGEAACAREG
jgi:hypothetical protein